MCNVTAHSEQHCFWLGLTNIGVCQRWCWEVGHSKGVGCREVST